MVVVAVVGVELLIGEVEAGEQLVLLENKVGYDCPLRFRAEIERLELLEAAHQKSKLRLKRGPALAFVKRTQERIRIRLHDALRIQPLGQNAGHPALSDPDGTFLSDLQCE